jgi:Holliday junction resolvase RusA-like endonuclease
VICCVGAEGLVKFAVFQEPIAKRAAFLLLGHYVQPDSKKMKAFGEATKTLLPKPHPFDFALYEGPVGLDVEFVFRRPDGHYKRNIRGDDTRLTASSPKTHTQKPDVDNMVKFLGDSLTGICYADDAQITHVRAAKRWSHNRDFTKVTLRYFNCQNQL